MKNIWKILSITIIFGTKVWKQTLFHFSHKLNPKPNPIEIFCNRFVFSEEKCLYFWDIFSRFEWSLDTIIVCIITDGNSYVIFRSNIRYKFEIHCNKRSVEWIATTFVNNFVYWMTFRFVCNLLYNIWIQLLSVLCPRFTRKLSFLRTTQK